MTKLLFMMKMVSVIPTLTCFYVPDLLHTQFTKKLPPLISLNINFWWLFLVFDSQLLAPHPKPCLKKPICSRLRGGRDGGRTRFVGGGVLKIGVLPHRWEDSKDGTQD